MAHAVELVFLLATAVGLASAFGEAGAAHNLRVCPREKSDNLGIIANREVCETCKDSSAKLCNVNDCLKTKTIHDPLEGLFIKPDFVGCDSRQTSQCNNRGIEGWVRFRLKKSCVMRNKAKRYDFTVHIKIPEGNALPVTTQSKIKVHGLPENNTKAWLSPLGEEIIFNINDVSWKDLTVFKRLKGSEAKHDLIVQRGFSIAPLNQDTLGFETAWFKKLNFARRSFNSQNDSSEIIGDDESAFFVCKQDHVVENIVTVAFWQQRIFTGIYWNVEVQLLGGKTKTERRPHFVTYKMAAVMGALVLFGIMICLISALLTLKKQASIMEEKRSADEEKPLLDDCEEVGQQM